MNTYLAIELLFLFISLSLVIITFAILFHIAILGETTENILKQIRMVAIILTFSTIAAWAFLILAVIEHRDDIKYLRSVLLIISTVIAWYIYINAGTTRSVLRWAFILENLMVIICTITFMKLKTSYKKVKRNT